MLRDIPNFPMRKSPECPFAPSPDLRALDEKVLRVRVWDGSTPWIITSYELNKQLLTDPRVSADTTKPGYPHFDKATRERRGDGRNFVAMDDPGHATLRRMLAPSFSIKNMKALRGTIEQIANGLIDGLLAGSNQADLSSRFSLPFSTQVICSVLGVPYADHSFFQEQASLVLKSDGDPGEAKAAQGRLRDYLQALVQEKIKKPGDDLISAVATAHVATGAISDEQLSFMATTLLIAGQENTANMISLGTLLLLQHPEQLDILRNTADPSLVARAVDELLRYLSISHFGRRRVAIADIKIGDKTIHAGDGLIFVSELANRDPEEFPDPDRFDIQRRARHHLALGYGPHHCLGRPLATLELEVAYPTLFQRIPTLRLATELDSLEFKYDAVAYGVYALPVTW
jgi:cytochrome P450